MTAVASHKRALFAVVIISFVLLYAFYGSLLISPNSHFFKTSGDGLKNYYTYAYYISYNVSNSNFEGMNYPYGEHVLFTDGHPLLSFILKKAAKLFPSITQYSIGILNSFLLLSLLLNAAILYLIFHYLKVKNLLAILSSIGIMMLNPQLFRFGGHYALAYSFFIPLTIYILLRFKGSSKKYCWGLFLLLVNLICIFTHAYLGLIIISLSALFLVLQLITEPKKRWLSSSYLLLSILLPIVLFLSFLKLNDTHVGRSTNTGDLVGHSTNILTVIAPTVIHPIHSVAAFLFPNTEMHWEDLSYIGFGSDLILLALIVLLIIRVFKRKKLGFISESPEWKFLLLILGSSFILLLFAMDFPFVFGLEEWVDNSSIEIIKNFRANGRFSWPFYYACTISCVFILNSFSLELKQKNKKVLVYVLIFAYPFSLMFDAYFYHKHVAAAITKSHNLFDKDFLDPSFKEALEIIDPNDYQAIIPLPYFNKGSKNFERHFKADIYNNTFLLSYHTGLPMTSSNLSRTSIKDSKNLVQLLSPPFYDKEIERDIIDDRPFLLIKGKDALSKYEKFYLRRAKLLFGSQDFELYALKKEVLFNSTSKGHYKIFADQDSVLFRKDSFLMLDTTSFFSYNDFEGSPSPYTNRGGGAYIGDHSKENIIARFNCKDFEVNVLYRISVWIYNCGPNYGQDQLEGALVLTREGEEMDWKDRKIHPRNSQVINACWSLIELSFKVNDNSGDLVLKYRGNNSSRRSIYIDDVLVYKAGNMIYRIEEEGGEKYLFENNHKIALGPNAIINIP